MLLHCDTLESLLQHMKGSLNLSDIDKRAEEISDNILSYIHGKYWAEVLTGEENKSKEILIYLLQKNFSDGSFPQVLLLINEILQ